MAWKHFTLRKKFYNNIFGGDAKPCHGHLMEYFIDIVGILASICFVVGCYCFMSDSAEVVTVGAWLFIVGSLAGVAMGGHTLLEQLAAMRSERPLKDEQRDELSETLLYLISSIGFAVGCIFFLPGLTHTAAGGFIAAGIGSWICIISSFMVVFSVFYNALGFVDDKSESGIDAKTARLCVVLTRVGMFLLLFGGVLFVVGSFMYRPDFAGKCPAGSSDATCLAVASYGTFAYLLGSYAFLVQTILAFIVGLLKHAAELRDKDSLSETSKLIA